MDDKYSVLKKNFGYTSFREGQGRVIDAILSGKDVVSIMPTGSGKSLCYQIPALMTDGLTLVISPLISLMKDQVNALTSAGVDAAYINSSLTPLQTGRVLENAGAGKYQILYVAPERLFTPRFIELTETVDIPFVAVDEAHCVSQWGQDFRPSYLEINKFITALGQRPVIGAFTATATEQVKADIIRLLELNCPECVASGFDRKNLYFEVITPKNKDSEVLSFVRERGSRSGIIYCITRKEVEKVCDFLQKEGYPAVRYHAGLSDKERKDSQERFQKDLSPIIVATNAFGMGIDKSNVSYVLHYNMPKNLESYYQEAGRAGRDGSPAECVLFFSAKDIVTNRFLIDSNNKDGDMAADTGSVIRGRELDRLQRMIYYCKTTDCLRQYILNYFGDTWTGNCGNCFNCNNTPQEIDITVQAQKILSCVKRMGERYGITLISDTLRGSKSERVTRAGLQNLKTYGQMKGTRARQIRALIEYLIMMDYLTLSEGEYPVVSLGRRASGVLFRDEAVKMKVFGEIEESEKRTGRGKRADSAKAHRDATAGGEHDETLFQRLRAVRAEIAKGQNVPPYIIFSDKSLREMSRIRPVTEEAFLSINGVGQMKLEKYGEAFLSDIREYTPTS